MITDLMPMLKLGRPLLLSIAALDDGRVRVCTVPTPIKGDDAVHKNLLVPLKVEGTPEELDSQLGSAFAQYSKGYVSIADAVAETAAAQAAAAQAAKEAAKTKRTNTRTPAKSAVKTPEPQKAPEPVLQASVFDTLLPSADTQALLDKQKQEAEAAAATAPAEAAPTTAVAEPTPEPPLV